MAAQHPGPSATPAPPSFGPGPAYPGDVRLVSLLRPIAVNGGRTPKKVPSGKVGKKRCIFRRGDGDVGSILRVFAIFEVNKLEKFIEI